MNNIFKPTVKMYFGSNFEEWILPELQKAKPSYKGKLVKHKLDVTMGDSEIIKKWKVKPFSISELAYILGDNLLKQPTGETGNFENTGYANIFYVRLKSGEIVAVFAGWDSFGRGWRLISDRLDDNRWGEGRRVFARN